MKQSILIGIALMLIGAGILGYHQFSYKSEDKVLDLGPIHATAERTHTVFIPDILGWVLLGGGAVVLGFGVRAR